MKLPFTALNFFILVFLGGESFLRATPPTNILSQISPGVFQIGSVRLDKEKRAIQFPATINMTNGLVEYFLVNGTGKLHESVLKTQTEPSQIHIAMLFLGAKGENLNVKEIAPEKFVAKVSTNKISGDKISIEVSWKRGDSEKRVRAEDFIFNTETKSPMSKSDWIYNGSKIVGGTFIAQRDGSIVSIITDLFALANNPRPGHERDEIWLVNPNSIPPLNTSVEVTFKLE